MSNLRIVSVEKSWYRLLEVMVDKSKIGNILEIERDLLFKLYSDFFGFLKIKIKNCHITFYVSLMKPRG